MKSKSKPVKSKPAASADLSAQAGPETQPVVAPPPEKRAIYYDGSRGPLRVTLRNPQTALSFETGGIRIVSAGDAQDLLSPAIGGGAFHGALPLAEAATKLNLDPELVASLEPGGELTLSGYRAKGSKGEEPYLVLDIPTRKRLTALAKEA